MLDEPLLFDGHAFPEVVLECIDRGTTNLGVDLVAFVEMAAKHFGRIIQVGLNTHGHTGTHVLLQHDITTLMIDFERCDASNRNDLFFARC